ncbi:TetR/AcrR family transcriptional regulator [Hyphomonas johnsonii]|uniref:TetR family transcriptional regulator n=1 Tax=Hyphomonas johnsonii MHS-2 TaxID=1280950 RepID=A0A059FML2_9PROT|nr:TetR/AcrR family transcriptional regulator [Hyphomonas johnsonii]KCZ91703.1 TetR family transcriptional regulator [Hyphomonas johnsonii MHS-2]
MAARKAPAKDKLIAAAVKVVREKGFNATSVDELCAEAGVTKGAFFHHFPTKVDLGIAAADAWKVHANDLFGSAPYMDHEDPFDRLLGYLEFRRDMLDGPVAEFTCLVGTMVQESYDTLPALRAACHASIWGHALTLVDDIEAARERHGVTGDWTAESLALHTQAVLQGAFILAKADNGGGAARDTANHLIRYVRMLFNLPPVPME